MIKSYQVGSIGDNFKKQLNDANRLKSDVNVDQFRLMDDGSPIVGSQLDEFPKTINTQKNFLDYVLADASDSNPNIVDLDTAYRNTKFLQESIKNQVAKESLLGEQGIQLAQRLGKQ